MNLCGKYLSQVLECLRKVCCSVSVKLQFYKCSCKGILWMILEDFKKCSGRIIRVSEHFRNIEAITCGDVSIFRKFCSQLVSHPREIIKPPLIHSVKHFEKLCFGQKFIEICMNEKPKHISDSKVSFLTWTVGLFRPYVEVSEFIPAWYNDVKKILILVFSILFRRILW